MRGKGDVSLRKRFEGTRTFRAGYATFSLQIRDKTGGNSLLAPLNGEYFCGLNRLQSLAFRLHLFPMNLAFFFSTLIISFSSFAQQVTVQDSISEQKLSAAEVKHHSVKKAVVYSAIVPGWGQVYNKHWWKVPIIYAGFGGLGFAIGYNTKRWRTYSDAYRARVDGDPSTVDEFVDVYSEANLVTLKNFYRHNRDLAIIFTTVLYSLNLIDAAVDAHLFEYDISDDLTLRVQPQLQFPTSTDPTSFTGLNMCMRF